MIVLRADTAEPWILPLGSASTIETLIRRWRVEIVERHAPPSDQSVAWTLGSQLRRRIWDPAAAHLSDVTEVFIVPDGDVNLIPFAALPVNRTGYLLEQGRSIHYLAAERDVVTLSQPAGVRGSGLLAIGGPAFSNPSLVAAAAPHVPAAPNAGEARADRSEVRGACGSLGTLQFSPLPASMLEAEAVLALSRRNGSVSYGSGSDRLLSGRNASEAAFKALGPGRRILHLATHGFVLGDDCVSAVAGLRGVGGLSPVQPARAPTKPGLARRRDPGNPLLLSGLAFAGGTTGTRLVPARTMGF